MVNSSRVRVVRRTTKTTYPLAVPVGVPVAKKVQHGDLNRELDSLMVGINKMLKS